MSYAVIRATQSKSDYRKMESGQGARRRRRKGQKGGPRVRRGEGRTGLGGKQGARWSEGAPFMSGVPPRRSGVICHAIATASPKQCGPKVGIMCEKPARASPKMYMRQPCHTLEALLNLPSPDAVLSNARGKRSAARRRQTPTWGGVRSLPIAGSARPSEASPMCFRGKRKQNAMPVCRQR